MRRFSIVLVVLLLAAAVSGCGVRKIPMPEHAQAPLPELSTVDDLKPIRFDGGVVALPRGETIGALYNTGFRGGQVCNLHGAGMLVWEGWRENFATADGELSQLFYDVLTPLGFNVAGDPSVMFNREEELSRAEYVVAARILDIKANICKEFDMWVGHPLKTGVGEMYLDVEWSVYSVLQRRVALKFKTTGYYDGYEQSKGNIFGFLMREAFASAIENFASNTDLLTLLRSNVTLDTHYTVDDVAITLPGQSNFVDPFRDNAQRITQAVVAVRNGGSHGSGFFISDTGHILTNYHVVDTRKVVVVRLSNGMEIEAKVLRRDSRRDVALLKVDVGRSPVLPIAAHPLQVAEEVFAVGTPVMLDLQNTVSKGVVSGQRYDGQLNQPYIQCDVDIHGGNSGGPLLDAYGNVVGISFAGISADEKKLSSGINYFIPIEDALAKLNIHMAK